MRDDMMDQVRQETDSYKDKCFVLETELSKKIEIIDSIVNDHKVLQERCDEIYLQKGAEGGLKVEVGQLQHDNAKLLRLLKQTKEFQQFANFVEDSGGNVKSVPPPLHQQRRSEPSHEADLETDQWLPNEAYSLAHEFRENHGNDLTPNLINQLLGDLNKIWREREKKQITRIKQ